VRTDRAAGAEAVALQPQRLQLVAVGRADIVHADHRCMGKAQGSTTSENSACLMVLGKRRNRA